MRYTLLLTLLACGELPELLKQNQRQKQKE